MRKTITVLAAMTAAALLGPAAAATAATAAPAAPAKADTRTVVVKVPMKITRYDKKVAAAHGYRIVTDARGRQHSVKIGATGQVSASNVVVGNCGSSYLYYDAQGDSKILIRTGFTVNRPAVSYWWLVVTRDDGGSTSQTWAGGLAARRSWGVKRTLKNMSHGASSAYVSSASSAILIDGGVCTSGSPSDFTWVY